MNLMIVGGGGREHALLEQLRKNPRVEKIYALPGNGGMAAHAECVPIRATDIDGIVAFAVEHAIDFAVIGPDDPLIAGVCDRLRAVGTISACLPTPTTRPTAPVCSRWCAPGR